MKTFRDFMEDGAGAVGSGAAGVQSSGGSPSISTSTFGVKGTGDDQMTVPVSKKTQNTLQKRASRVKEVKESRGTGRDQHYGDTTGSTSGGAKGTPITTKKMNKDASDTFRKITGSINVGEKTAPAETFMTKEEVEEFKKGDKVYLKTKKLQNSPHTGKVAHVTDTHVHIKTLGGTGMYKAPKSDVTKDAKQSHLHKTYGKSTQLAEISQETTKSYIEKNKEDSTKALASRDDARYTKRLNNRIKAINKLKTATEETVKAQKEIVSSNSKTEKNPTGFVKKKFSDIRVKE